MRKFICIGFNLYIRYKYRYLNPSALTMHIFFSHIRISSVSVCEQVQRDVWQTGNGTENEGAVFLRTGYQFLHWGTSLINGFWLVDFVNHKEAVYNVLCMCSAMERKSERETMWVDGHVSVRLLLNILTLHVI